jgi:gamma-butyrobetaine dioxygenase
MLQTASTDAQGRFDIATVQSSSDRLEVVWKDGHCSMYPSIWLLQACTCEKCGNTESAVRHVRLTEQPARPEIVSAQTLENGIGVDWGGGHQSRYDAWWLRNHCLSDAERQRRQPSPVVWGVEVMERLPYMDFADLASDPECHLEFLETVRDLGFVILKDVPKARERTEEVAGLVGKLRLTNYGIFELEAKPNPEIVGDMAMALELHTDEPYRIEPPAITFFHVLEQSSHGGDSTLADGLHLAHLLRERNPDAFEILCTVPARFHRTLREGRAFEFHAPVIARDKTGRVLGLRLLDRGMGPVDAPVDMVEPFYDAVHSLLSIIYAGEGRITVKLQPGEMLVFNNQRLMHGRTAFDPSQSKRHVRSCHVDLDEFHSRLRVAYRAAKRDEAWMALGSGASHA